MNWRLIDPSPAANGRDILEAAPTSLCCFFELVKFSEQNKTKLKFLDSLFLEISWNKTENKTSANWCLHLKMNRRSKHTIAPTHIQTLVITAVKSIYYLDSLILLFFNFKYRF